MIGVLILAVLFGFLALGMVVVRRVKLEEGTFSLVRWAAIPLSVGLLLLVASTCRTVGSGQVGVPVVFGKVGSTFLTEGLHFVNPVISVKQMSVRTEEYTMSGRPQEGKVQGDDAISTKSSDGATLVMDITIWYRLLPSEAPTVYRTLGPNYAEKIVRPAVRTAIREAAKEYTALGAFSTDRDALTAAVEERVNVALEPRGILLEKANIRQIELPQRILTAINDKLAAEQAAQAMEFVLQKETQQAEVRRVEARGLADAQRIINESLTNEYLQWKYVESLQDLVSSGNSTVVVLPFDQALVPLLNVPVPKAPVEEPVGEVEE